MISPQNIISFWFEELTPEQRFSKNAEVDQRTRDRFLDIYNKAQLGLLESWRNTAEGRLAEIIILDQFPRNMFRDSPQAFASDPLALKLAKEAVAAHVDQELSPEKRSFLYMPYMHSEDAKIHTVAVVLFSQKGLEMNLKFELMHKKIIDRFGRYPHRNQILGRTSTEEEVSFLKEDGSSF